jgi:hypothetical protein
MGPGGRHVKVGQIAINLPENRAAHTNFIELISPNYLVMISQESIF